MKNQNQTKQGNEVRAWLDPIRNLKAVAIENSTVILENGLGFSYSIKKANSYASDLALQAVGYISYKGRTISFFGATNEEENLEIVMSYQVLKYMVEKAEYEAENQAEKEGKEILKSLQDAIK